MSAGLAAKIQNNFRCKGEDGIDSSHVEQLPVCWHQTANETSKAKLALATLHAFEAF